MYINFIWLCLWQYYVPLSEIYMSKRYLFLVVYVVEGCCMFVFLSKSPQCYVFISAIIVQSGPIPRWNCSPPNSCYPTKIDTNL